MTLLKAKSLAVEIGELAICTALDLEISGGQRWCVLGSNGIGKTTLLHTLAGLRPAAAGTIDCMGKSLAAWNRKALAREMGIVFQDSQDTFPMTVLDTALAGRHPYLSPWALESEQDIAIAAAALADVQLADMATRQVDTLSGGERRRLALAGLLVQSPRIWILDEPTNHLDPGHQIAVMDLVVRRLVEREGAAIMAMHDINLALRYCTHALLMIDADELLTGEARDIVNEQALSRLYNYPVKTLQDEDGRRYFYQA